MQNFPKTSQETRFDQIHERRYMTLQDIFYRITFLDTFSTNGFFLRTSNVMF